MLVHPDWAMARPVPVVLWMHGRTASKEIDPGRALRLMRAGIGVCAVDLPGHGDRFETAYQQPTHTLDLILKMTDEIDEITEVLAGIGVYDMDRMGIGGMSAGGMATLRRLCSPHRFVCASVEAATGAWRYQQDHDMFLGRDEAEIDAADPASNLHGWREIPIQALHGRLDAWVACEGQAAFIEALRRRYDDPSMIEFITYGETGAPFEHAGFGKHTADAKERQRRFFMKHLLGRSGD
jgi:dienelactone hydrolase